jgi:Tol biopolymer transport system component
VAACVALGWILRRGGSDNGGIAAPARFTWTLPVGLRLESPAVVSPDGHHLAFAASAAGEPPRIYLRPLDALEAQPIPRTEGARHPFWSPDGRSVAYFARGKLLKVAIDSGVPVEICAAVNPMGGAWGSRGVIVFAPNTIYAGLLRVAASGGTPEPATELDSARGENSHRWPVFLPDGIHFVYFVRSVAAERRGVYLARIDRAAARPGEPLFRSESDALYLPTDEASHGVLLNAAGGHIDVHPFDTRRLTLDGDPTRIDLPASGITPHHRSMLSGSTNLLTHVASSVPYGQRLVSSARAGDMQYLDAEPSIINWPRVSPDGRRIVSQRLDPLTGSPDLWVQDLDRRTKVRLNTEGTSGQLPVWSPDGAQVAFLAGTFERPAVTIAAADGTGVNATLPCPRFRCEPSDWSRDGRWLLVTAIEKGRPEVWMLPIGPGAARPLLTEPFPARDARVSPDGQLVAYVAEETGRAEVSVRTIEGPQQREVVSVSGGRQPVWNRSGTELLFVDLDGVLRRVEVGRTAKGRPTVGSSSRVGDVTIGTGHYGTQYDVSSDGRVYFLDSRLAEPPRDIGFVLGWRELLRK